jgi:hypothetical protein
MATLETFRRIHQRFSHSRKNACIMCGSTDTPLRQLCDAGGCYPCCFYAMQCMRCGVHCTVSCECKILCYTSFCPKHQKYIPAYRFAITGEIAVKIEDHCGVYDHTYQYRMNPKDALQYCRRMGESVYILLHIDHALSVRCYIKNAPSALISNGDLRNVDHALSVRCYTKNAPSALIAEGDLRSHIDYTYILSDLLRHRNTNVVMNIDSLALLPQRAVTTLRRLPSVAKIMSGLSLMQLCIYVLKRNDTPSEVIQRLPLDLRRLYRS